MKIQGIITFTLFCAYVLCSTVAALARDEEKRIEQETRQHLAPTEHRATENKGQVTLDYGGWFNYRYIVYDDDDNNSVDVDEVKRTHWIDSRLWFKATLKPPLEAPYENEHYLYVRIKDLMLESRPEEASLGGWDHDGVHLEYAYINLDSRPFWLKVGRQYFSVGQGIAYGDVNDGAELIFLSPKWGIKTFMAHTLPHEENIDTSVSGYDKESDRYFYGFEYNYSGVEGHNFYGYAVMQKDYSNPRPQDPEHKYLYDSQYFGLGGTGRIAPPLSYTLELIKENGKSFIFDTGEKKNVDAWAGRARITYEQDMYSHPKIFFEYAFGSGDSDRESVTDTEGGNISGKDTNFLYFGYIPTGYALFPRLSNLHIYHTGMSLRPMEKNTLFKRLSLAVDYYKFYKDKASGGIYDTEATENYADVGSEIDVTLGWRIFSDLGCSVSYGHFMPGKAYPESGKNSEDYFSVSTTFTF